MSNGATVRQQVEKDESLVLRRQMIESQITSRGIRDERVLEAMMAVPRERFVPPDLRHAAFDDRALPIGHEQTISQPFIVAYMTEQLDLAPTMRVLEVGTGSGYQCAILAKLCRHVYTIERLPEVFAKAKENLAVLGFTNITAILGDGTQGLPVAAPFDRVLVTAAAPAVPKPLVEQLVDGGVMVLPVGGEAEQIIVRVTRDGDRTMEVGTLGCRFVKLVGRDGWQSDP